MIFNLNRKKDFSFSEWIKDRLGIKYVYVIYLPDIGKTKIGVAKVMDNRMRDIASDYGKVNVITCLEFWGATTVEKRMHKVYDAYRSPEEKGTGRTEMFKIRFFYSRLGVAGRLWLMKGERLLIVLLAALVVGYSVWEFGYLFYN